jgi:hypothetical protein
MSHLREWLSLAGKDTVGVHIFAKQASRPISFKHKETQIDADRRFAPDADRHSCLLSHPELLAPEPFETGTPSDA